MPLNLEDAVKIILNHVGCLEASDKPLLACPGLVAAKNVYADFDLPQTDTASRDGYAVRSRDIREAAPGSPALLRITAVARAGRPPDRSVTPGAAIRIMTGSMIPRGADCVVQFEDTDEPGAKSGSGKASPPAVKIFTALSPGDNIISAGNHIRKGSMLLQKGSVIGPAQISALASMGKTTAGVIRRPSVAIMATGDELVHPGRKLTRGKIYNGNSATVAALVNQCGGIPKILGIARDKEDAICAKIQKGFAADAVIIIGGVSGGDYDLVRPAVSKIGKMVFAGIRMMPGKATAFGVISRSLPGGLRDTMPVFCLSGTPSACLVGFETLIRPALLKMLGFERAVHPGVEATVQNAAANKRSLPLAMFAALQNIKGEYHARFVTTDNRHSPAALPTANAMVILPEGADVRPGDRVEALPLNWR